MHRFFKINHKFLNFSKGFTLVETLIAISIFTASLLGLLSIMGSGISNTTFAKQRITASYLAQECIEYVRNERDTKVLYAVDAQTGWSAFKTAFASPANLYPTSPDFASFTRIIEVETKTADDLKISCTVSWKQPSGNQSITLSENLFNWLE